MNNLSEPLNNYSPEVEGLQNDYNTFNIFVTKINREVDEINKKTNEERNKAIKQIIPSVERLGDFLSSLNQKIKHIESNEIEKLGKLKESKVLTSINNIKLNSVKDYECFNKKFQDLLNKKSENKNDLNKEVKKMRNEDLENILKISNQINQISKEMKRSLHRTDESINTIEYNVVEVKENLQKSNSETDKFSQNNTTSYKWLAWSVLIMTIIVIGLIYYIYIYYFKSYDQVVNIVTNNQKDILNDMNTVDSDSDFKKEIKGYLKYLN